MLATSDSVQRLLDLEDRDPDVLHETAGLTALPLWPRVRMFFAQTLAAAELGENAVATAVDPWAVRRRLVRSLLPSRWDARGLRSHRGLLAVVGGGTVRTIDDREDNWLVGDYLKAAPDRAAALQWRPLPGPGGRPSFSLTRSLDPMDARVDFRARGRSLGPGQAERIETVLGEYARLLDGVLDPEQLAGVTRNTLRFELLSPLIAEEFARILDRVRPRTVLMEDASYGHRGHLIAQLKDRGIHVAEPQHGWIGPSHGAYNFGAAMSHPDMLRQLPDELLTFGSFWSDGIRVPYSTTPIGKPHLQRAAASAPPLASRSHVALVVSSIADPHGTQRFILALRDVLPEWTIRFRPHPSERASIGTRYPQLAGQDGIEIDPHSDVYDSLSSARAVIGTASTVIYEAVPFGTEVFVRQSPHTDYYAGTLFGRTFDDVSGPSEIARQLDEGTPEHSSIDGAALWSPDAAVNVRNWVSSASA